MPGLMPLLWNIEKKKLTIHQRNTHPAPNLHLPCAEGKNKRLLIFGGVDI
jgi:hypothetical protein